MVSSEICVLSVYISRLFKDDGTYTNISVYHITYDIYIYVYIYICIVVKLVDSMYLHIHIII